MGCPGVETRYPYILAQANTGVMSFSRAVELCATNPAKIFGCDDRKGSLSVGKDADIVVYDPQLDFTVHNDNMHGNNDQRRYGRESLSKDTLWKHTAGES